MGQHRKITMLKDFQHNLKGLMQKINQNKEYEQNSLCECLEALCYVYEYTLAPSELLSFMKYCYNQCIFKLQEATKTIFFLVVKFFLHFSVCINIGTTP